MKLRKKAIKMNEGKGKLYLIPSPLGENDPLEVIPMPVLKSLEGFSTFVVEEVRTARRYLSRAGLKGKIGELSFHELNEHTDQATVESYIKLFENGNDVALISEAGLPAVADPGAAIQNGTAAKKPIRNPINASLSATSENIQRFGSPGGIVS